MIAQPPITAMSEFMSPALSLAREKDSGGVLEKDTQEKENGRVKGKRAKGSTAKSSRGQKKQTKSRGTAAGVAAAAAAAAAAVQQVSSPLPPALRVKSDLNPSTSPQNSEPSTPHSPSLHSSHSPQSPPIHFGMQVEPGSLNRAELEQLYQQNVGLLRQQQRYIKMLEHELINLSSEYQKRSLVGINWSVYKQFLGFLAEPPHLSVEGVCIPGVQSVLKVVAKKEEGEEGGEEDEEFVLSAEKDFYAKFLKSLS